MMLQPSERPKAIASRIPGCHRINNCLRAPRKRLKGIRLAVARVQQAREQSPAQQAWLRDASDTLAALTAQLDRLIANGEQLPGAEAVRERAARIVRKRPDLKGFAPQDRWQVGYYEP